MYDTDVNPTQLRGKSRVWRLKIMAGPFLWVGLYSSRRREVIDVLKLFIPPPPMSKYVELVPSDMIQPPSLSLQARQTLRQVAWCKACKK